MEAKMKALKADRALDEACDRFALTAEQLTQARSEACEQRRERDRLKDAVRYWQAQTELIQRRIKAGRPDPGDLGLAQARLEEVEGLFGDCKAQVAECERRIAQLESELLDMAAADLERFKARLDELKKTREEKHEIWSNKVIAQLFGGGSKAESAAAVEELDRVQARWEALRKAVVEAERLLRREHRRGEIGKALPVLGVKLQRYCGALDTLHETALDLRCEEAKLREAGVVEVGFFQGPLADANYIAGLKQSAEEALKRLEREREA
jgi:hypothetical protein